MRERATLRLDSGDEFRVEVDRDDLVRAEIVVRRADEPPASREDALLAVVDRHLATADPHAAGTIDRLLEADRSRPF
jgi:hypothetical protein